MIITTITMPPPSPTPKRNIITESKISGGGLGVVVGAVVVVVVGVVNEGVVVASRTVKIRVAEQ